EKSIIYIEDNLNRNISLDELATHAFCSKYHFHRIFKAMTGKTVSDYIRQRKLKKASLLLLKTDKCIRTIAFECGFNFHESFTRVFKKTYGLSPEEYRSNKRIFLTCEKLDLSQNFFPEKPAALSEPTIIEEPSLIFIGTKCLTDLNSFSEQGVIFKLWDNFNFRIPEVKNRIEKNASFGIGFYNSSPRLGYIACVRVGKTECLPRGMESKRVPSSRYAKFTHKGTDIDVIASLDYIFSAWLTDKDYKLSSEIDFIIRMDERCTGSADSEVDILIPIKQ
ncbi:MAG TPA: AraC family transcriptional regulator, partial [Clostridia bacterium]|nr:AraC family transcriptional regulator [Clostridia bacterium]